MLVLCLCCVCALGVPAAPSVVCMSRAWHPNIDLHTGYVSLPILNKDWRPVLSINTVVFALQVRTKSYLVWHQYQVPVYHVASHFACVLFFAVFCAFCFECFFFVFFVTLLCSVFFYVALDSCPSRGLTAVLQGFDGCPSRGLTAVRQGLDGCPWRS